MNVWPLMTTIGFGAAGRAGVVGRAGVGDGDDCGAGCGCGAATGLRFVVGLRLVWLTEIAERASKRIRGKGLSFIPELMLFLLNVDFRVYGPATGRTVLRTYRVTKHTALQRTAGLLEHKETIGAACEAAPKCELQLV